MNRFVMPFAALLALVVASCSSTTQPTTGDTVGKIAVDSFAVNPIYAWYQLGYDAYPLANDANAVAAFNANVTTIKNSFDPAHHRIIMVVKPNCSCQKTQTYMPRIMKTLDMAGVPHANIDLYITDTRLVGFDSVKTRYKINVAPTFIVTRDGVDKGSIVEDPLPGKTVDQLMAEFMARQ